MMSKFKLLDFPLFDRSKSSNTLRNSIGLAIVTIAAFTICSSARAQHHHVNNPQVSFSRGTILPVTLNSELSSNTSVQGDTFVASIDNSKISAYGRSMRDATVTGVVNDASPERGTHPGTLHLKFTSLHLSDGRTINISGSLTTMDSKQVHTNKEGILQGKNSSKDHRYSYAGVGAGVGALVTVENGGDYKIADTIAGETSDYDIGSVVKGDEQGHDINLEAGTSIAVILNDAIAFNQHSDQRAAYLGHTYIRNGSKYYSYNGKPWVMNIATGDRFPVSGGNINDNLTHGNRYNYEGHNYYINRQSGVRTQLD
jgi:hypothetical protein